MNVESKYGQRLLRPEFVAANWFLWHFCAVLTPGTRDFQAVISLEGDCQF